MTFWLRENAGHSKIFAAPFRFTIERGPYPVSVEKLQIGFGIGVLLVGARAGQTERILSKKHPKHLMRNTLTGQVGNNSLRRRASRGQQRREEQGHHGAKAISDDDI